MNRRLREALWFIAFATGASVVYGVLHDTVTANVAVTYFSVYHPRIIQTENPFALALVWGFAATFWMGLIFGSFIAVANAVGAAPPLDWRRLRLVMGFWLVVLFVSAMAVLATVYLVAGQMPMPERRATFEADRRLVAVAMAHVWSYAFGTVIGLFLAGWTAYKRLRHASPPSGFPRNGEKNVKE